MRKLHLAIPSELSGIYRRVAVKCHVDLSLVSRVTRGERKSRKIEACLNREISKLLTAPVRQAKVKRQ